MTLIERVDGTAGQDCFRAKKCLTLSLDGMTPLSHAAPPPASPPEHFARPPALRRTYCRIGTHGHSRPARMSRAVAVMPRAPTLRHLLCTSYFAWADDARRPC